MRSLWLLLCIALWASLSGPAVAATAQAQTWRAVLFDGRKVGWSLTERESLADGAVRSAEIMDLEIQREGISISMRSLEETVESASGEPLSFRAEIRTAGQELRYSGKPIKGRKFEVTLEGAGDTRTQILELPPHALFFEGQRQALLAGVRGEQSLIAIDAFVPSQLAVVPIETSFKRRRRVELMRDEADLIEVEQLVRYPDGPMQVSAYVDDNFDARRIRMDLAGIPDPDHADFVVECGSGTYMRSLARDLARALGGAGHVSALRRLKVGPFTEAGAITLDKLKALGHIPPPIAPVETVLDDIPALAVTGDEANRLRSGQAIALLRRADIERLEAVEDGAEVCVMAEGRALALARRDGATVRPVRILNPVS